MTKFQELKGLIRIGRCAFCNGATNIAAGSRNIRIVACEHDLADVCEALQEAGVFSATKFDAFRKKTAAEIRDGAWEGGEFVIAKEAI
jgi:hypothetical protein